MIKITLPVFVKKHYKTKKDKNIYINLNNYRNRNRFLEHEIKESYQKIVIEKIRDKNISTIETPLYIKYILYVWDKRLKDTNNILCIADKYVSDALVEWNFIEDDNYNFIKDTRFRFWWFDKGNARIEVEIYSDEDMFLNS